MIASILVNTCDILRRQSNSRNDDGDYDYYRIQDVPCLFTNVVGRRVTETHAYSDTISGFLTTVVEVLETDKIVFSGYEYVVKEGGVNSKRDLVTGAVVYYKTAMSRTVVDNTSEVVVIAK